MNTTWLLMMGIAYLVGGVPFGLLIGLARGVDIRQHGSRNIGATNTWRVLGARAGTFAFILDFLKGALPVLVSGAIMHTLGARIIATPDAWSWLGVAIAAVLGHMFSPYLRLKGGKGVATAFGAMLALWPHVTFATLIALIVWIACAKVTRMVSASSIAAAIVLPTSIALLRLVGWPIAGFAGAAPFLIVTGALATLVIVRHRANIVRILNGTENRIGAKKQASASGSTPPAHHSGSVNP